MGPGSRYGAAALAVITGTLSLGHGVGDVALAARSHLALAPSAPTGAAAVPELAFTRIDWRVPSPFVSFSPASGIQTSRVDGTARHLLSGRRAADSGPSWSPDGEHLVFGQARRYWRLVVIRAGGGGRHAITPDLGLARSPAWAPRGGWIAFVRMAHTPPPVGVSAQQVWLVHPDGTGQRPVTTDAGFPGGAGKPTWSPDGRRLAFWGLAPGRRNAAVYVSARSGRSPRRIIPNAMDPAWSPDGTRIAFSRGGDIYTANPNGGQVRRVTRTRHADDTAPAWSPDGAFLAVQTQSGGGCRITVIRLADARVTSTITSGARDVWLTEPAWRPDTTASDGGNTR